LAEKIGVSEVTISRYVNGERTPRSELLEKMATVLNTTTDYLLGRSDVAIQNEKTTIDDTKEFAKHFTELRLKVGFKTIDDLAKAADVWSLTIKRIESGQNKMPSPTILEKLAKPLGISAEELIEAAGYAVVENGYVKAYDDNFKGTRFSNLTPEEQKNILDQIEFYESRRAKKK
jgi:transcriptional regulator with XRE-family HTH domain